MEKYDIHLLALAHVYSIPQLKQRCIRGLGERLTLENVVDLLQLSRLCNAPDLHLRCMKLVYSNFKAVEKTEGWKFLQDHDPCLELEVLQFIDEAESVRVTIMLQSFRFHLHTCPYILTWVLYFFHVKKSRGRRGRGGTGRSRDCTRS